MRNIVSALIPTLLLCGCVTAPADGSDKIQTTSEAKRESMQGAVSTIERIRTAAEAA